MKLKYTALVFDFVVFCCVFHSNAFGVVCQSGTYLPVGHTSCVACDNGFYCAGGDFDYDEISAHGINQCPDGYNMSDENADSEEDCFKNYTCPNLMLSDCDEHAAVCNYVSGTDVGYEYYDGRITATCEKEYNACSVGYFYVEPIEIPTLPSISTNGNSIQYRALAASGGYTSNKDNDLISGEFKIIYNTGNVTGTLKGRTNCVTTSNASNVSNDAPSEIKGRYCLCILTGWTPSGDNNMTTLIDSWAYDSDGVSSTACSRNCARYCAEDIQKKSALRSNLFNSLVEQQEHCERDPSVDL